MASVTMCRDMQVLADPTRVHGLIQELAAAIRRDMDGRPQGRPWALIGIQSRGDVLAKRLAKLLKPDFLGTLDITLYRDDLAQGGHHRVRPSEIDFDLEGLDVVLVDDVLMTGRSARAALQSLVDLGRPRRVWLAVLVDRGGRELPIAADQIALDLRPGASEHAVRPNQVVQVQLEPTDPSDRVVIDDA